MKITSILIVGLTGCIWILSHSLTTRIGAPTADLKEMQGFVPPLGQPTSDASIIATVEIAKGRADVAFWSLSERPVEPLLSRLIALIPDCCALSWDTVNFRPLDIVYEFRDQEPGGTKGFRISSQNSNSMQYINSYHFRLPFFMLFVFACLGCILVYLVRFMIMRRRRREGRCEKCSYDLSGLSSAICPECGTGFVNPVSVRDCQPTCDDQP